MPVNNKNLRKPDAFLMNEDTVNQAVASFLISKGFDCETPLTGRQHGVDIKAEKNNVSIYVESKGSRKNSAADDEVFDQGQLVNHMARQIYTLMKYESANSEWNNIYILANPDIERIRIEYNKVKKTVQKLKFICMWVQSDNTVIVENPESMNSILLDIGIL